MKDQPEHIQMYLLSQGLKSTLTFGGVDSEMRPTETTLDAMLFAIENGYQDLEEAETGIDRITLRRSMGATLESFDVGEGRLLEMLGNAGRGEPMFRKRAEGEPPFLFSDLKEMLEERAHLGSSPAP